MLTIVQRLLRIIIDRKTRYQQKSQIITLTESCS